jgi:hypothetical protein
MARRREPVAGHNTIHFRIISGLHLVHRLTLSCFLKVANHRVSRRCHKAGGRSCQVCGADDMFTYESIVFPRMSVNSCIILHVSCVGRQELERRTSLSNLWNSSTHIHARVPEFSSSSSPNPSSDRPRNRSTGPWLVSHLRKVYRTMRLRTPFPFPRSRSCPAIDESGAGH